MSDRYEVEIWDITRLIPYEKNAKKHDKAKISTIARRMRDPAIGFTQPIQVERDGTIIAGHGRRMAALEAGFTKVPVLVFKGTKEQAAAERLADNQLVSTGMDMGLFQEEILRLNGIEPDLVLDIGLTDKDLEFTLKPLDTMDESLFVDDVQSAVEEQREKNTAAEEAIDAATAPLADAFGFRRLTVSQSRRVRAFQTQIEAETGKKGADALMVFLDNMGVAA